MTPEQFREALEEAARIVASWTEEKRQWCELGREQYLETPRKPVYDQSN